MAAALVQYKLQAVNETILLKAREERSDISTSPRGLNRCHFVSFSSVPPCVSQLCRLLVNPHGDILGGVRVSFKQWV